MSETKNNTLDNENFRLLKTLLYLTNPPIVEKPKFDKDGMMVPKVREIKTFNAKLYKPRNIRAIHRNISSVRELFPNQFNEDFAKKFFGKIKKDNVSGIRYAKFKKDSSIESIEAIKKRYKPKIEQLKKDILETERRLMELKKKRDVVKRRHLFQEILQTERTFVRSLKLFVSSYVIPSKSYIEENVVNQIHGSVDIILKINDPFLKQLEKCFEEVKGNSDPKGIPELFIERSQVFKLYIQYVNLYGKIIRKINELLETNEKFKDFVQKVQYDLKGKGERATTVRSFLIMPVQRIPRYALLLNDLKRKTDKSHPEYKLIETALKEIESVATYVNAKKKEVENSFKVIEIIKKYKLKDLLSPSRKLIIEGTFVINESPGEIFVFNDLIILIRKGKLVRINVNDPDVRCNQHRERGDMFVLEMARQQFFCACESIPITVKFIKTINNLLKVNQKVEKVASYNANIQREIFFGMLKKEGGGKKSRALRKRWHVITGDKKMKYFEKKGGKMKGSYSLIGAKVGTVTPQNQKKKNQHKFFIKTLKRTYILKAESEKEMRNWLQILGEIGCGRE